MECLGRYTFLVMTSVILSCGLKMRDEHGMLRKVYIPGFGGLGSGDGRTDRLKVWGGGLGSCM